MDDICKTLVLNIMVVQALQLWLQCITLLAGVNGPSPAALHWLFSAASYAFSTVTSGSLSIDCLLTASHNTALQRTLIHLAVPPLVLAAMVLLEGVW